MKRIFITNFRGLLLFCDIERTYQSNMLPVVGKTRPNFFFFIFFLFARKWYIVVWYEGDEKKSSIKKPKNFEIDN